MKVHQAIPEFLEAEAVDTVYSFISDETLGVLSSLRTDHADAVEVIEARHEQAAVAMADGYARASGGIGVAMVGRGPAIAQTGTALTTAEKAGSKLLVIVAAGDRAAKSDALNKDFAQQSYLDTLLDSVLSVPEASVLVPRFAEAFRRLHHGDGPVAVQIPTDVFDRETDAEWESSTIGSTRASTAGTRFTPDPEQIEAVIDRYLDSDASVPPLILAGRGAVRAEAKAAIEDLAERTSAMLATTLQARGYFGDHPYSVGFVGTFGPSLANEYLSDSDFILAVGCSLNDHTTDKGRLLDESTVVQIDADPGQINRHNPVDLGVVGDAREAVEMIDAELEAAGIDFSGKFWTEATERRLRETSAFDQREYESVPGRMDPRELLATLDDLLPADRLVINDVGHFMTWVFDGISIPHPDDYVWAVDFGAVGIGHVMGLGAARAAGERTPIIFTGDGGFMMSVQEIDTAVRQGLPVVVVVVNDDALGAEYQQLKLRGGDPAAGVVETPELAAVVEGFGAEGHTIRSVDELEEVSDRLDGELEGPVVLDCKVNREVRHRFYDNYEA